MLCFLVKELLSLLRSQKVLHGVIKSLHEWSAKHWRLCSGERASIASASVGNDVILLVLDPSVKEWRRIYDEAVIGFFGNISHISRLEIDFLVWAIQFAHSGEKIKRIKQSKIILYRQTFTKRHLTWADIRGWIPLSPSHIPTLNV